MASATETVRTIPLAREIMTAMLMAEGNISSRQTRAIEIAASTNISGLGGKSCYVESQSGHQSYRVRGEHCNCPDCDKGNVCKHVLAIGLLIQYAELLAERLDSSWNGSMEGVVRLERAYQAMLDSCAKYCAPESGMLTAYRLEALGDDEYQHFRSRERRGETMASVLRPLTPWIARIKGACPQYEFARDFIQGHKDYREADKYGSCGVWIYYELPPGLYEVHQIIKAAKRSSQAVGRRFFAQVKELKFAEIVKDEVITCLQRD